MEDPADVVKFSAFPVKVYVPFLKDVFPSCSKLVSSHWGGEWWPKGFLCSCGTPPRNFFVIPVCLSNMPHLYQFSDCLVAVALAMPLKASRLPLAMISRRKCSWTAVWCGIMPLSEHDLLYLFQWYRFIIVRTRWKASLWAIDGRPRLIYLYSDIYWSLWVLDGMDSLWALDGVASRKC